MPDRGELRGGGDPGQAEVDDLDLAVRLQVDVGGLQVAMDDPVGVRKGEAVADLIDEVELGLQAHRPLPVDDLLEVRPLQQLHGDVQMSLLFAEVVDGDDVRVVEAGGRLRLAQEAPPKVVVGADPRAHGLDGDVAAQDRVVGAVDVAHRSLADLGDDLVLAEPLELHASPTFADEANRPGEAAQGCLAFTGRGEVAIIASLHQGESTPCPSPGACSRSPSPF